MTWAPADSGQTHASRARRLPARGDESGQILVLTLGLTLVVLLLVTVIVSGRVGGEAIV